jgi:hypothetical protein
MLERTGSALTTEWGLEMLERTGSALTTEWGLTRANGVRREMLEKEMLERRNA